jgi:hypothetical protein
LISKEKTAFHLPNYHTYLPKYHSGSAESRGFPGVRDLPNYHTQKRVEAGYAQAEGHLARRVALSAGTLP